jgi:hypothetical protein
LLSVEIQLGGEEEGIGVRHRSHHVAFEDEVRTQPDKHVLSSVAKEQQLQKRKRV